MLPTRISNQVEKWFDKDYRATFYERVEFLMESEPLFKNLPFASRYGKTLGFILDRISVFIQPGENLVGSVKEIIPTDEQAKVVEELTNQWWDTSLDEIQKQALWFYSYGWLRRRPPWFFSLGHLALDWEGIITKGLGEFESYARQIREQASIQEETHKMDFLHGAILSYQALSRYIQRYADQAKKDAELCADPVRRVELLEISERCSHLSTKPARNFIEALQLIWLIVLPLMKVCGCGVFNLHRMDQYLYSFYRRDLENGVLSRQKALELLEEFFFKNNDIMTPTDHMSQEIESTKYTLEVTYDDPNYITIGGLIHGDLPGVNDLSSLFVEAAHNMRLRNPFIVVRYYPGIDQEFWLKVVAAMRDNATLVVYNDQTMIPALQSCGVDDEDVIDYGFYGCNDPNIPALEGGLRQVWFNMLRPLELALHQGNPPLAGTASPSKNGTQYSLEDRMIGLMTGSYFGVETASLETIHTIDDLLLAYQQQMRYLIEDYRQAFEKDFALELECNKGRLRIEDCFLAGTIDNATTWNNGGTKYHKVTFQGSGLASVVDSLAAVQQLVFIDQEMSLKELVQILRNNFEGHERLRVRLNRKMPKYGNNIAWVDELGRRVVDMFCDEIERVNSQEYVYTFYPVLKSDRDFTTMGVDVGATPDGRLAGQPISENQSPSVGADQNGLTALLNSVSALPFDRVTGGPLNLKIHPSSVEGENGLRMLSSAMQTYFDNGGLQLQMNVVSRDQLLEAQKYPERYKSLCVRVTGYSAYFVQMGKKAQDELINRTEAS